jgi:hypothetical protein
MKRSILFLSAIALASIAGADTRIWPPSPYSVMNEQGAVVIRFIPKIDGNKVVSTRVMLFTFDRKTARYAVSLDRELSGLVEPTYAFQAKDPNVLVFVFSGPDLALAVVDTASQKTLVSKTFRELVPEFTQYDYRDRSISTLHWCQSPWARQGKLYLPGGLLEGNDSKRGPSFVVDLASYQIEREKE